MLVKRPSDPYDPVMTLGHRVQELREQRGWSREQLGVFAGLSASTIGRIENDKIRPRPATIIVLAQALGIEPAELAAAGGVHLHIPPDKWS
jgi:transcriptional regulator with XRE-family HTH domain